MEIGRWNFEGPWEQASNLINAQGLYAVLGRNSSWDTWTVIDIGQSSDVRNRVENHDRADCWSRQGFTVLAVAVLYTLGWTEAQRLRIEQELRQQYSPACGVR